jgi:hypothetical protein
LPRVSERISRFVKNFCWHFDQIIYQQYIPV